MRGMWSAFAEKRMGNPERANFCQNVRFYPGVVRTRPGTLLTTCNSPIAGKIAKGLHLANLAAGWAYFYLLGTQIRFGGLHSGSIFCPFPFDLNNPVPAYDLGMKLFNDSISRTPYTLTIAFHNNFAYIAVADKTGNGCTPCLIATAAGGVVDVAFSAYASYKSGLELGGGLGMSFTSIGAGACSPGQARYAIVLQTGTGYLTPPLIQTAPSFGTASRIQASISIPTGYGIYGSGTVYLLKTRVDNPNAWYWVPNDPGSGTIGSVPYVNSGGGPQTFTFIVNISDADMAASLDSADDQWFGFQQFRYPTLRGPFSPQFVTLYGKRMCYGVGNTLYASDINDPQQVTADRHVVQSPKELQLGFAFSLAGSADLFLTGTRWIARVTDNGDVPATWAPPIVISDTIGAPFPGCVCHRTAGSFAWIVADSGVYVFDGSMGEKPVTFLVSDQWARVNWNAAYCIETEDNVVERVLYVTVPLDGATEVTAVFCIDYSNGLRFDAVDISLDVYAGDGSYSVAVGSDELGISRVWFGSDSGNLLQQSPTATMDPHSVISSTWESGFVRNPGDFASRMVRVGGMDVWARGDSSFLIRVYGPEKLRVVYPLLVSQAGVPAALSPAPGLMYHTKFDFSKIENYNVRFDSQSWFELSGFTVYSRPDLFNR